MANDFFIYNGIVIGSPTLTRYHEEKIGELTRCTLDVTGVTKVKEFKQLIPRKNLSCRFGSIELKVDGPDQQNGPQLVASHYCQQHPSGHWLILFCITTTYKAEFKEVKDECVCSIQDLMMRGCKCGHLEK